MPEMGHRWCARADNAFYLDGATEVDVTYADGSSPQGCECAAQETHDWLIMNMVGNAVPMDGSVTLPPDVVSLRNNIYQETENECYSLVPDELDPNNCNDGETEDSALDADAAVAGFQSPGISYGDRLGEEACTLTRYYEVDPPAGDCKFIDGSYSFSTVPRTHTLEVGAGFVDKVLGTPGCLYLEKGRIELNANGSFEFVTVGAGELLYELGIRSGDIPTTLNGYDISTVSGAYDAWEALQNKTNFTLIVRRGGGSTTLQFTLV